MLNFEKINRLCKDHEFKSVFCSSSKNTSKYFILLKTKNHLAYSRIGLVITKKKIPLAVDRNRIKRLIRDFFRLHLNKKTINNYDIIFMVKYNISKKTNKDILADFFLILQEIC